MKVEYITSTPNAEKIILAMARVSSDQSNTKPGLINFLIRQKHWSPFEMAHMTVGVETSRAIAAQILRHRFSFQEFSQRYAEPTGFEKTRARRQAEKNRQSSIDDLPDETIEWFDEAQDIVWQECKKLYDQSLEQGISRENARMILPLATQTKIMITGNLRNWIHYLELRTQEDTQLEHREIAEEIKRIFIKQFPYTSEALEWK